ncbi:proline-rich protein 36 isoform X2 [Ixodes scapularis]|uniref:proline-rich protein 36 isoform X2 n=1 Tax=Ixodes scapularis TaxID=6945 RepID=UPI001A9EEF00|nr:proline-rich protein 36 isoform X2 [Ixodes scapularis]
MAAGGESRRGDRRGRTILLKKSTENRLAFCYRARCSGGGRPQAMQSALVCRSPTKSPAPPSTVPVLPPWGRPLHNAWNLKLLGLRRAQQQQRARQKPRTGPVVVCLRQCLSSPKKPEPEPSQGVGAEGAGEAGAEPGLPEATSPSEESPCAGTDGAGRPLLADMPDLLSSSADSVNLEDSQEEREAMPCLEPLLDRAKESGSPEMPLLTPAKLHQDPDPAAEKARSALKRFQGNVEVDSIDGVDFFSFSSAEELLEFTHSMDCFPTVRAEPLELAALDDEDGDSHDPETRWTEEEEEEEEGAAGQEGEEGEESSGLLPRKTTDVTQIKGWRRKAFCAERQQVDRALEQTTQWVLEQQRSDCGARSDPDQSPGSPASADGSPVATPVAAPPAPATRTARSDAGRELSREVRCAFVSSSLDEFLEHRAELRVSQLAQLRPNIRPPPVGAGVLALTVFGHEEPKKRAAGVSARAYRDPHRTARTAKVSDPAPKSGLVPKSEPVETPEAAQEPEAAKKSQRIQKLEPESEPVEEAEPVRKSRLVRKSGLVRTPKQCRSTSGTRRAMSSQEESSEPTPSPAKRVKQEPPEEEFLAMTSRCLGVSEPADVPGATSDVVADFPMVPPATLTPRQQELLDRLVASTQSSRPLTVALSAEPTFVCPQLNGRDANAAARALATEPVRRQLFEDSPPRAKAKSAPATQGSASKTAVAATLASGSSNSKTPRVSAFRYWGSKTVAASTPGSDSNSPTARGSDPETTSPTSKSSVSKVRTPASKSSDPKTPAATSKPWAWKTQTPTSRTSTPAATPVRTPPASSPANSPDASSGTPGRGGQCAGVPRRRRGRGGGSLGVSRGSTRSRRPIRLPARFQDSELLLSPTAWDQLLSALPPRAPRPEPVVAAGPVSPPAESAKPTAPTTPRARDSSSSSSSSWSSSSSSGSSSGSSTSPAAAADPKEKDPGGRTALHHLAAQRTKGLVSLGSLTKPAEDDSLSDTSEQLSSEEEEAGTPSTPPLPSEEAESAAVDEVTAVKASRERVRRKQLMDLFVRLQNAVFSGPSERPLPKVSILQQALRYLSCLKTLSHHLDGEKRRLRRRQLDLQTCLAAARKGHTFLSRLEPLPPSQPVPRLVAQVCDLSSPTLEPLRRISDEVSIPQPSSHHHKSSHSGKSSGKKPSSEGSVKKKPRKGSPASSISEKQQAPPKSPPKPQVKPQARPPLKPQPKPQPKPRPQHPAVHQGPLVANPHHRDSKAPSCASTPTPPRNAGVPTVRIHPPATPDPASLTYKLDGGRIGSLRTLPANPEEPRKYTLYPAKGTVLGDLSKVAAAAQHLIGPCVIKRVTLKTGQTVFVYRKPAVGGGPGETEWVPEPVERREEDGKKADEAAGPATGEDGEDEEDLADTSEWVSGDGDTCIVVKLPVDDDEDAAAS